jgi:hypothetical protein
MTLNQKERTLIQRPEARKQGSETQESQPLKLCSQLRSETNPKQGPSARGLDISKLEQKGEGMILVRLKSSQLE